MLTNKVEKRNPTLFVGSIENDMLHKLWFPGMYVTDELEVPDFVNVALHLRILLYK